MRGRLKTFGIEAVLVVVGAFLFIGPAWAGPPFFTDDPEPVEYLHWEIYVASQWAHDRDSGTSGTLPHLEINYGVVPDVQLHLIAPMAYSAPHDSSTQYGLGDIETGIKYRFIHEDEKGWRPQVGVFPIVDFPSGDALRGLGSGHINIFLPIWVQKSGDPGQPTVEEAMTIIPAMITRTTGLPDGFCSGTFPNC